MGIIRNICFPSESNNPSFPTVLFHEVSRTPMLFTLNIRLQQNAIVDGICGTKDFNVIGK
jgi:hypothetical protein